MDSPSSSAPAAVTPVLTVPEPSLEDMNRRRSQARTYWENYQGWVNAATSERDTALERLEQQVRFGMLAEESAAAARQALEEDYATRMRDLETGPTYELLQSEYAAQRSYAEARGVTDFQEFEDFWANPQPIPEETRAKAMAPTPSPAQDANGKPWYTQHEMEGGR